MSFRTAPLAILSSEWKQSAMTFRTAPLAISSSEWKQSAMTFRTAPLAMRGRDTVSQLTYIAN